MRHRGDANETTIPPRRAAALVLGAAVLGALTRFTPETSEWGWIVRVAGASLVVGVAPGAAMILAWRPRRSLDLFEWLGLSVGFSCAFIQLLTVAALTLHLSPDMAIVVLGLVVAVHLWAAFQRSDDGVSVRVSSGDAALLLALAALGLFLYAEGSPFVAQQEERVHISIIQRLSQLRAPSIENIYLSPGVVYTYPFPGTHYLMALMSRAGDIEPAFLYHKLRAFWGVTALILLWGCARAIFDNRRMALAATLVAIVFVANGTFAAWSQMAPFSHAADVAMGVLLPALLLMAFTYLRAIEPRDERFCLVGTMGMALMLIMVHPREIVQFLVYVAAFGITLLVAAGPRPLRARTGLLLVLVTAVLVGYRVWYRLAVPEVESIVTRRQEDLWTLLTESSWATWVGQPLPMLDAYMPAFALMFRWWIPVVLLGSPVLLYVLRHRPLTWLLASSIAVYLALIRFPVLAIPYVYGTYFEMLYAPVRNVAFFAYLLAGVFLYVVAARLALHGYAVLGIGAAAVALTAIELFRYVGPLVTERPDLLFFPVLAGYALALISMISRRVAADVPQWLEQPRLRWGLAFALMVIPIVAGTWVSESAVATLPWVNHQSTPAALLASVKCGDELDRCAPPPALIQYVRSQVSPQAILAVDYRQVNEPTLFLPQQVIVWSGAIEGLVEPERVFPAYFKHLERARAASLEQPFFNDGETRAERLAFIHDLGVTHLLVTPRVHQMMTDVLARDGDLFTDRYDDGQWALYEVNQ